MTGMRFLRIHQRQRTGRQSMALTTALITPYALQNGTNSKGVVAMATEGLPGKIGMKQLDTGQPRFGEQSIAVHLYSCARIAR